MGFSNTKSSTADKSVGIPSGGSTGQVLTKNSDSDHDTVWADAEPGPQGEQGIGIPTGGSAGQVLTKKTGADYDTEWATLESGGSGGSSGSTDVTKNNCRVIKEVASFASDAAYGTVKIVLPGTLNGDTMMRGEIVGYDHVTQSAWRADFAGLAGAGNWSFCSGVLYPGCPFSTIRTGHDGQHLCILLGTTSTLWSYPSITIPMVQLSYIGMATVPAEWGISIITSESGITFSGSNTIKTISYT
ncbi:MAG: hypothetical protein ACRDBM_02310 [Sporomusa sp.]